ncbi:TIM23 complex component [Coemansia sp. RSA 2399]|nr:TIM23 complex component [Coemansia sp. RSA 2399]KAJ1906905.1 TIM23 complex component [Coemansia sp. IMI 209127]
MLGTLSASRSAMCSVARLLHRPATTMSMALTSSALHQKQIARGLHTSRLLLSKEETQDSEAAKEKQARRLKRMAKEGKLLDWEDFFALRRERRLWERVASIPCAVIGLSAGAAVFATLPIDPQQMFFGFDPLIVFGAATLGCMVLGYGVGPSIGRAWYRVMSPAMERALRAKETEFFKHVKANRSDPSLSSMGNPLPDFYGEKINSLEGYRKWLRKQREHERKGTFKLGQKKR